MNELPKSVFFPLMYLLEPDGGAIVKKIRSQLLGTRVHFMEVTVILGLAAQEAKLFLKTAVDI